MVPRVARFALTCGMTLVLLPVGWRMAPTAAAPYRQDKQEKEQDKGKDKDKGKEKDSRRPTFSLKATPGIAFSPATLSLIAELKGGANDFEEYYCATVEWDWGDGTKSESSTDCEPYEAGKSEIKRRFASQRVYATYGNYRIEITLKQKNRAVAMASTTVQVHPGLQDRGFGS